MNQGIHLRWERPTARGVRYYQVDLHQDLWGEWLLTQAWGRRGTRLGRVRVAPCGSHAEGAAAPAVLRRGRRRQSARQRGLIVVLTGRRRHEPAFLFECHRRHGPVRRRFRAIRHPRGWSGRGLWRRERGPMREDGWHLGARLTFGPGRYFAGQAALALDARFHHNPLRGQGRLAGGDLLLLAFVLGLARRPGFPVTPFDRALRAALLLAFPRHPHPGDRVLAALGGGDQELGGLSPLRRGYGVRWLVI